jgi:hypothetical protein
MREAVGEIVVFLLRKGETVDHRILQEETAVGKFT